MGIEKCLVCKKEIGSDSRISFFGLPKTPERKQVWLNNFKLNAQEVAKSSKVCSIHFSPKQLKRTRLVNKAIPRILFPDQSKTGKSVPSQIHGTARKGNCVAYPVSSDQENINSSLGLSGHCRSLPVEPNIDKNLLIQDVANFGIPQEGKHMAYPVQMDQEFINPAAMAINVGAEVVNRTSVVPASNLQRLEDQPLIFVPVGGISDVGIALEGTPVAYPTQAANLDKIHELRSLLYKERRKFRNLKYKHKYTLEHFIQLDPKLFDRSPSTKEFILSQIKRFSSKKKSQFTSGEKTLALTMYYTCGKNGYRTLRTMFYLPSLTSIRRWIMNLDFQPGINSDQINILREQINLLEDQDKDCVIMWDEVSIKQLVEYNKYTDTLEGVQDHGNGRRNLEVASEALVVMVRGIRGNWKFPISYYYSKDSMSSDNLHPIIIENLAAVTDLGLRVKAGVCDMGFTNQGLYRRLGVTESKPYIAYEGKKIYMLHDTPHLLKLVRNSLMSHNFIVNNKKIKWSHILNFWRLDCRRLCRMCPKLSKYHFNLKTYSKMNVKLATQIFSHSVYAGMLSMIKSKQLKPEAKATALFIKELDDMFDLLNVSSKHNVKSEKSGVKIFENIDYFDRFISLIQSIHVPGSKRVNGRERPDSFVGLETTLRAVKCLIADLKAEGYQYVLTRRIQQDGLEHFFSFIRMRGGWCRNPTARQFRQSFRFSFISSLVKPPLGANCEPEECKSDFIKTVEKLKGIFEVRRTGITKKCNSLVYPVDPCLEFDTLNAKAAFEFYKPYVGVNKPETEFQVRNVATYMANAIIKSYLKRIDCRECNGTLLNGKIFSENPDDTDNSCELVTNKAFSLEIILNPNDLSYGTGIDSGTIKVFTEVLRNFESKASETLSSSGNGVSESIIQNFQTNIVIKDWLKCKEGGCVKHRSDILNLCVRALIFRLIKDKNENFKQSKSWSQTRKDLRNQ